MNELEIKRSDPYFALPTMEMVVARAKRDGISNEEAYAVMVCQERKAILDAIADDPYREHVEPSIYWVMDALIDFPYCQKQTESIIRKRLGMSWGEFKVAMRKHLGFNNVVRSLLVSGANRSSKTFWAILRAIMLMENGKDGDEIIFCHEKQERSREHHQNPIYKLLPKEHRQEYRKRGIGAWLSFSSQTGFSGNRFQLPTLATMRFAFYSQEIAGVFEGALPIMVAMDENFPEDWLKAAERRVAQKNGFVVCPFTPVGGWTTGIQQFIEHSTVVKQMPAYLLPRDGGAILPWMEMGLTEQEYRELENAEMEKRPARAPWSRPQDCLAWLEGRDGKMEGPKDRAFQMVPRVAMCANSTRAIVYMLPCDNPYGNPRKVIEVAVNQGAEMTKRMIYGQVQKRWMNKFPGFDPNRDVVNDADIPNTGNVYMYMDPASGRNPVFMWIRSTEECDYIIREWPGNYHIPGVGVPEAWAIPSSRNPETGNDGDRGGAQKSWDFTLLDYKFEISRIEGWRVWREWADAEPRGLDEKPTFEQIDEWMATTDSIWPVRVRMVDCRPASVRVAEKEARVTMRDNLETLGMGAWELSPNDRLVDGEQFINTALGMGRLKIARSCENVIFAFKHYTGADKQEGAVKDMIDPIRWHYMSGFSAACNKRESEAVKREAQRNVVAANNDSMKRKPQRFLGMTGGVGAGRVMYRSGR